MLTSYSPSAALALGLVFTLSSPAAMAEDAPLRGESTEDKEAFIPPGPHHEVDLTLTEGTWMSLSVSGDTLLFDLLGDIWSMPIGGGVAKQLTSGIAWDAQPRFSPDGTEIAFVSDRGGNEVLWIMPAAGGEPKQLLDEGDARITQPVWDGDSGWLLGRRRTVDTRSIGVTEIWQYHRDGGSGIPLTSLDDHPHAGEMALRGDYVYFSSRSKRFEYGEDPYSGLWSIQRLNRKTGDIQAVVRGVGSASRPTLSPDGDSLVFISRSKAGTLLEVMDLRTGARRVLSDKMGADELEGFALHGTYPTLAWHGDALIYWAQGKLWRQPLNGERVEIPFSASGTWRYRSVERWEGDATGPGTAQILRYPTLSPKSGALTFAALGRIYSQEGDAPPKALTQGMAYFPTFGAEGDTFIHTTFDDAGMGAVVIKRGRRETSIPVQGQAMAPALSPKGDTLAFLRTFAPGSKDLIDVAGLELMVANKAGRRDWEVAPKCTIKWHDFRAPALRVTSERIYFTEHRAAAPRTPMDTILVSVDHQCRDKRVHLNLKGASRAVISPDGRQVAFQRGHAPYISQLPPWGGEISSTDALPTRRLAKMGGSWLAFSPDGKQVLWFDGPELVEVNLADLPEKKEDMPKSSRRPIALDISPKAGAGAGTSMGTKAETIALVGGRILPMNGGEVREGDAVIIEGNRIKAIGGDIPEGARVIDVTGKTLIPGLIDVHAHLHYTAKDILPTQEWRYQVNLDFGVTTVHDPSASSDVVFTQAERVRAGEMAGPRVFSTGAILYGALDSEGVYPSNYEDALAQVERMKALGATSVKVYQQSQRERRQYFVAACHQAQVLCVAEGGGDLFMDLTMIADGFHALEHSLPQAPLYQDVRAFMAASHQPEGTIGPAYTPTLLVAYGGLGGEHYFRANFPPKDYPRLKKSYPPRELASDTLRWSLLSTDEPWYFQNTARSAAEIARDGGLVTLGAHGQFQGLGAHWELWALGGPGAMSPLEALEAATMEGARYLGLGGELGSIEAGKLADIVVLNQDPREDIHHSVDIHMVIKDGVVVSD